MLTSRRERAFAESKADFRERLVPLLVEQTDLPLAVLDYRLAPADPHPAQISDVLSGLNLLTRSELLPGEGAAPQWDRSRLVLLGHSAGAFMCLQVLFEPPPGSRSPRVPPDVQSSVERVFLIDGIYDLPSLLDEYPSYVSFVSDAFGDVAPLPSRPDSGKGGGNDDDDATSTTYALESPARWVPAPSVFRTTRLHVLHSQQDELLSLAQPEFLIDRLWSRLGDCHVEGGGGGGGGEGEQVLVVEGDRLAVDYVALEGGHYEVVHARADRLARYVAHAMLPRSGQHRTTLTRTAAATSSVGSSVMTAEH